MNSLSQFRRVYGEIEVITGFRHLTSEEKSTDAFLSRRQAVGKEI